MNIPKTLKYKPKVKAEILQTDGKIFQRFTCYCYGLLSVCLCVHVTDGIIPFAWWCYDVGLLQSYAM